jgi:hypothetical protein
MSMSDVFYKEALVEINHADTYIEEDSHRLADAALQRAQVYANLAIADRLETIADTLTDIAAGMAGR